MKILFIGSVEFSLRALEKIIPHASYVHKMHYHELIAWMTKFNPDVIFCFGRSNLMKYYSHI